MDRINFLLNIFKIDIYFIFFLIDLFFIKDLIYQNIF